VSCNLMDYGTVWIGTDVSTFGGVCCLHFNVVKVILSCYENGDSKMLRNLVTYVRVLTASYPRRLTFLSTLP
jgi:hypothetical protein